MKNDNVISLEKPAENEDLLTGTLRQGARELITIAVQTELAEFLAQYQDVVDDQGRRSVVRNGYLPERDIMTGIGPVAIKVPRTRDRSSQVYPVQISTATTLHQTNQERRDRAALVISQRYLHR